jgi:hypothetical protein
MRKWLYAAVKSCPGQAEMVQNRIYSTGGVEGDEGPGDNVEPPFIVLRFGTNNNPRMPGSTVKRQFAEVWVHTSPGSMIPTDDLVGELEKWLPSQAPARYQEDRIMECDWQFTSGDGFDDHYRTTTRYVEVLVTFNAG